MLMQSVTIFSLEGMGNHYQLINQIIRGSKDETSTTKHFLVLNT